MGCQVLGNGSHGDSVGLGPAQAFQDSGPGPVFAADPAPIAKAVDGIEQGREIDIAAAFGVRLIRGGLTKGG